MSEDDFTGGVRTDAAEIGIVERRLSVFVERGTFHCIAIAVELVGGRRVPRYTEAVNIE